LRPGKSFRWNTFPDANNASRLHLEKTIPSERRPSYNSQMKNSRFYIWLAAALLLIFWAYALFMPVVSQKEGVVFYVKPGMSRTAAVSELSQQGLVRLPPLFYLYVYLRVDAQLKTGEYQFPQYASAFSIWRQLTTRTGIYYRRFTIIPGKTFAQIRQTLSQTEGLRPLTNDWDEQKIMQYMGQPALAAEGQFFPETYYYTRDTLDLVVLKRAFDLMQNKLDEAWAKRAPDLPYQDKYQALIAASLIEREAYLNTERPLIGGVIVNRLRKNMLLQIDPTVIYGLGTRYDGKIHKKDLLEKTPYNTYVNKGLPPTPIAMPSMASIDAALHPVVHHYLYFVAKGDGSHQFSATLPEHQAAVNAAIAATAGKNKT